MQKLVLSVTLVLCLIMLAGCSINDEIDSKKTSNNTFLLKEDGSIESATVEDCDKTYYDNAELEAYVTEKINNYNTEKGSEAITKKSLEINEGRALLILTYASIEDYNIFNEKDTVLLSAAQAKSGSVELPQTFTAVKKGKATAAAAALDNNKYEVLIVKEKLDVLLQGTIKYYTGGTLKDKHGIQTSDEESTVIIFKP